MSTLEKSIEIAAIAHAGQVDKTGQPYVLHPIRLMLSLSDPMQRMAAMLHDVVEDTPVSLGDLRSHGFPEAVVAAVDALTKRHGETRLQAAARAAANPVARAVKLADVADNMDLSRIDHPTGRDHARIAEYAEVRRLLLAAADCGSPR